MRVVLLLLIGLTAWTSPAAGQVGPRGAAASVLVRDVAPGPLSAGWPAQARDSVVRDIRPTYWKEGALVGGLAGAVAGLVLSSACEMGCMTAAILGGGLLLVLPGALIGGQFRKGDRNNSPSD